MGAHRQVILPDLHAILIDDQDRWVLGLILRLNHDFVFVDSHRIGSLFSISRAIYHILIFDLACCLHDGVGIVRIPLAKQVALLYLVAIFEV